jgi:hypothetical protein
MSSSFQVTHFVVPRPSPSTDAEKSKDITNEQLRAALTAYVNVDKSILFGKTNPAPSLRKAAEVHAGGRFTAVTAYYKRHILPISGPTPEEAKSKKLAAIDNLVAKKRGIPDFIGQTIFSESECDTIKEWVIAWGQVGFPFEMTTFGMRCRDLARAKLEALKVAEDEDYDERLVSQGGDVPDCGERWYRT